MRQLYKKKELQSNKIDKLFSLFRGILCSHLIKYEVKLLEENKVVMFSISKKCISMPDVKKACIKEMKKLIQEQLAVILKLPYYIHYTYVVYLGMYLFEKINYFQTFL